MTLGSLWDDFGMTLGCRLDDFGTTLGSLWGLNLKSARHRIAVSVTRNHNSKPCSSFLDGWRLWGRTFCEQARTEFRNFAPT